MGARPDDDSQKATPRTALSPRLPDLSTRHIVARFLVTGLLGLAIITTITSLASRRTGTNEAIVDARNVTAAVAKGVVERAITPELIRGDPRALANFDRVVTDVLVPLSMVRTKLWDANGRIVYANEPNLVGQRFPLEADQRAVLATGGVEAEISDLSKPENRFDIADSKLLEVYARVQPDGTPPLLFETYFSYSSVTESGRRVWLSFVPIVLGSLLLLQLLQFPLAWAMARRLQRGQAERERLLQNAVDASDAERRRIARDLHDGTVQDLAGVSLALTAASRRVARRGADGQLAVASEADHEVLDDAAARVRNAITSLRTLLVDIYPPNLQEAGLDQALTDLAERLPGRGITPHLDITMPARALRPDTIRLLYRAAQEAQRNTVSHSGATDWFLRMWPADGTMQMTISDNGRGFDLRADGPTQGHVGLRVLREIIEEAGGSLTIESAPGSGTRLGVEVPA